jgi:hypothetical protein
LEAIKVGEERTEVGQEAKVGEEIMKRRKEDEKGGRNEKDDGDGE